MKKIIILLMLAIMLSGCAVEKKPLAVLVIDADEPLTIEIRDEFDPTSILSDVEDETEVTYVLNEENFKLIITLAKEDREDVTELPVELISSKPKTKTYSITVVYACGADYHPDLGTAIFLDDGKVVFESDNKVDCIGTYGDGKIDMGRPDDSRDILEFTDDLGSYRIKQVRASINGTDYIYGGDLISED